MKQNFTTHANEGLVCNKKFHLNKFMIQSKFSNTAAYQWTMKCNIDAPDCYDEYFNELVDFYDNVHGVGAG